MFGQLVEEVRWALEARSKEQQLKGQLAMQNRAEQDKDASRRALVKKINTRSKAGKPPSGSLEREWRKGDKDHTELNRRIGNRARVSDKAATHKGYKGKHFNTATVVRARETIGAGPKKKYPDKPVRSRPKPSPASDKTRTASQEFHRYRQDVLDRAAHDAGKRGR
jgi:hypothetical protein